MSRNINIIEITGSGSKTSSGLALRKAPTPGAYRSPAASQTLMRHVVKKPGPSLKRHLKAQGPTDLGYAKTFSKLSVGAVRPRTDAKRPTHSTQIAKSNLISHFTSSEISPRVFEPNSHATPSHNPNLVDSGVRPSARGLPRRTKHSQTTAELLDQVLRHATAHEQLPPKRSRNNRTKHHLALGSGIAVVALLVAVVATQNLSNMRLQVASAKAGFGATLPDYQPAGFSQGGLNYSPGVVAANFHSNSDDRAYNITQKTSPWNSLALRDNFVAPQDSHYQSVGSGGRTIYLYGKGSATWVNNGVWYVIQSRGALSDHQLIELAASL